MYRLFNIDSASLRIFARRPNMLFCYVVTLNHYTLLLRYHAQDSAGSAFVVTSYNLDYITFFYMRSHFQPRIAYIVSRIAYLTSRNTHYA
jgi:hypothetical protein